VTEADWTAWRSAGLSDYHRRAIDCFGAERCMFGSDWPVCLLAAEYSDVLELLLQALSSVSEGERADILGGTAARAYGL
jgi:L-fuconolactonase